MYVASPCPTFSSLTISSGPPESVTNVVTGGGLGLRGARRLCVCDVFPARFDLPETQAVDGYAYWVAVQLYNHSVEDWFEMTPSVSTDAPGRMVGR